MARFKNLPDGSKTIWAAVVEHKNRQRNLVIGAVLAAAVAGGGGYGIFRYLSAEATVQVGDTWSKLSRCLVGEPLQNNEKASLRLRAVQLAALTQGDAQRAPGKGDPWPERCAPIARQFEEALKSAGKAEEGKQDIAYWTDQLAVALKQEGALSKDYSEQVDQIFDLAKQAGLEQKPKPEVPAPPAPAQALTIDGLSQVKPLAQRAFELKELRTEQNPGMTLRVLVENKDVPNSPFICTFDAKAPKAGCKQLPKAAIDASRTGLHLLGSAEDDAAPLVFAGNSGADGVFRSNGGDKLQEANVFGGYVAADGFAAVLGWDKPKTGLQLLRVIGGKTKTAPITPATFKVKPADLEKDTALLWTELVMRGKNASDETWLTAAEVKPGAQAMGDPQDIGMLPADTGAAKPGAQQITLSGCRSSEATVLRAVHGSAEFLSFFAAGKWTKPVRVPGTGGALGCRKSEATITRVVPDEAEGTLKTTINHFHCTPASCESDSFTLQQLLSDEQGLAPTNAGLLGATGFDGKLLVVWIAGSRGGLRMRLAAPSQIVKTADTILFDDLIKDGVVQKGAALFDVRVFAVEKYAIVLMNTGIGLHALRIEPDGKFAPVDTRWEK